MGRLERLLSSSEEQAKVKVDLFGRYVQVKPAQFAFDTPEKFYPYLANKFGRYIISHDFLKSNREIRFTFENFPKVIHLKKVEFSQKQKKINFNFKLRFSYKNSFIH